MVTAWVIKGGPPSPSVGYGTGSLSHLGVRESQGNLLFQIREAQCFWETKAASGTFWAPKTPWDLTLVEGVSKPYTYVIFSSSPAADCLCISRQMCFIPSISFYFAVLFPALVYKKVLSPRSTALCSAPSIHSSHCPGGVLHLSPELQLGHCHLREVGWGGEGRSKRGSPVQSVWGK